MIARLSLNFPGILFLSAWIRTGKRLSSYLWIWPVDFIIWFLCFLVKLSSLCKEISNWRRSALPHWWWRVLQTRALEWYPDSRRDPCVRPGLTIVPKTECKWVRKLRILSMRLQTFFNSYFTSIQPPHPSMTFIHISRYLQNLSFWCFSFCNWISYFFSRFFLPFSVDLSGSKGRLFLLCFLNCMY